jgi:hypothetical protein
MMMKRKILKDFELTEISGVDRPAQPTAKMTIMKRADTAGDSGDLTHKDNGVSYMSDKNQTEVADLQKSVQELTDKLAKAEAAQAEAEALATLNDVEKASMDKMSDEEKADYMKMTPEERKRKMAEMKKNDETVVIDGETVSKSAVGAEQFAVLKSVADRVAKAEERIAKAEAEAARAVVEKRAETEFKGLPGELDAKVSTLLALEKMDADAKTYLEGILKSHVDFVAKASTEAGAKAPSDKETALEKRVTEIAKRDSLTREQAYVKVLEEQPDLYDAA